MNKSKDKLDPNKIYFQVNTFKDRLELNYIPRLEKMIKKEKKHIFSLLEYNTPVEFLKRAYTEYLNLIDTRNAYEAYLEKLKQEDET